MILFSGIPKWLPPVAGDGSTKGGRTTIPDGNRRGKVGAVPYQVDLAVEDPTRYPISGLKAHPCFRGTHLAYRAT